MFFKKKDHRHPNKKRAKIRRNASSHRHKENARISINKLFTTDEAITKLDDIAKILILSTNHAAAIAKNNLILFDPSKLKRIASIDLNLQANESILNLVKSSDNELQVISYTADSNLRIQSYDISHLDSPRLIDESKTHLSLSPKSVFRIHGGFVVCYEDSLEIRDNSFALHQRQIFTFSNSDWLITPVSSNKFFCSCSGITMLFTKENGSYSSEEFGASHADCSIKSMCFFDGIAYIAESTTGSYVNVWVSDLKSTLRAIPYSSAAQIFSLNVVNNVLAINLTYKYDYEHLGNHIELWDLDSFRIKDIIPLGKNFKGKVFLLPDMSMMCCDTKAIDTINFPNVRSFLNNRSSNIDSSLSELTPELKKIIDHYAVDISLFREENNVHKDDDEVANKRPKISP